MRIAPSRTVLSYRHHLNRVRRFWVLGYWESMTITHQVLFESEVGEGAGECVSEGLGRWING